MYWTRPGRMPESTIGRSRCLALLLCIGATSTAAAAGTEPAPERLAWEEVVRAVDADPRLASSRHRVTAARGAIEAADELPNPTLEVDGGLGVAREGSASRGEWGLSLTMPLDFVVKRGAQLDAAEAEVEAAIAETAARRRDVLLQLRSLFLEVAAGRARIATLEELAAQSGSLAAGVSRRVERGEARPVEATRAELEHRKLLAELAATRTTRRARAATLAAWLGLPAGRLVEPEESFAALPATVELDAALALARERSPALALARARTRALEAEVAIEEGARLPGLAVTGFTNHELDRRAYGAGLAVDLPILSWNGGRIARAEALLASGRSEGEAEQRSLEALLREAHAECLANVERAASLRREVVPRAVSAAEVTERSWQLGEANLFELIDARRTLLDVRLLEVDAALAARLACSRLEILLSEASK